MASRAIWAGLLLELLGCCAGVFLKAKQELAVDPPQKAAIFSALAANNGLVGSAFIKRAIHMKCSATVRGSKLPFHLLYGGGAAEEEMKLLRDFGWIIENHTADSEWVRKAWKPVLNKTEALEQAAKVGTIIDGVFAPQKRGDGWTTYYKFFAWNSTQYTRGLMADVDLCFTENPDAYLEAVDAKDAIFMAQGEKTNYMGAGGLNSHMAIFTPGETQYRRFWERVADRRFVPRTNTEQDILEEEFKDVMTKKVMSTVVPHRHAVMGKHGKFTPGCMAAEIASLGGDCVEFQKRCVAAFKGPCA